MKFTLVLCNGDGSASKRKFGLRPGAKVRIGRDPKNEIQVAPRGISNRHLELRLIPGDGAGGHPCLGIQDFSSNGTGLQTPGKAVKRLDRDVVTAVPDGAIVVLPLRTKKAEQKTLANERAHFAVHLGNGPTSLQVPKLPVITDEVLGRALLSPAPLSPPPPSAPTVAKAHKRPALSGSDASDVEAPVVVTDEFGRRRVLSPKRTKKAAKKQKEIEKDRGSAKAKKVDRDRSESSGKKLDKTKAHKRRERGRSEEATRRQKRSKDVSSISPPKRVGAKRRSRSRSGRSAGDRDRKNRGTSRGRGRGYSPPSKRQKQRSPSGGKRKRNRSPSGQRGRERRGRCASGSI